MQVSIIILSLIFSAFFSGSETAFISANMTRLEVLVKQKKYGARLTYKFLSRPENFLITILAGNNITTVIFSFYVALMLHDFCPEWLIVTLSSVLLLVFGEILPKTIAREIADRIVILCTLIMKPVHWFLSPITFFFEHSTLFLSKLFQVEKREEINFLSKKEMLILFGQSSRHGAIESEKGIFINKILNLREIRVREILIPRIDVVALPVTASIEVAQKVFQETEFSRILVFENSVENVIGKIHVKDLFDEPKTIREILQDVIFVPESKTVYDMLLEFKNSKTGLAVVIDEHGSLAGVVSVEDVVEELFGEIPDEHDKDESLYHKLSDRRFLIHSRLEIDFANEILNFNLPAGNYETVGGLIMTKMGKIPKKNEVLILGNWQIMILEATPKNIGWIKFIKRRILKSS